MQTQSTHSCHVSCSKCNLRELCMPLGLNQEEMQQVDALVSVRQKINKGETLFNNGDVFKAIYAIRTGTFKTRINTIDGRDQVTGFHIAGEIIGLDGMGNDAYSFDSIALEDSEVCVIPYDKLEDVSRECPSLQSHFHRIMSREIVRDHGVMLLLGSMRAEERLAAFLLNLIQRLNARGFSSTEVILRMTREEIGSYLGLKLETISRTFSKFSEAGLISVNQRHVIIQDPVRLRALVSLDEQCH